jgi:hypothetical protein
MVGEADHHSKNCYLRENDEKVNLAGNGNVKGRLSLPAAGLGPQLQLKGQRVWLHNFIPALRTQLRLQVLDTFCSSLNFLHFGQRKTVGTLDYD